MASGASHEPAVEGRIGTGSTVWSDSKANEAFDNHTGIELDAQRGSKQQLKNVEFLFLLWIFNVSNVSDAIIAIKRQRASLYWDFSRH